MENSAIFVQVLGVAAVVAYSAWNAMKKAGKTAEKTNGPQQANGPQGRHLGENFPFPKSTAVPTFREQEGQVQEPIAEMVAQPKKNYSMTDGLAVASVQASPTEGEEQEREVAEQTKREAERFVPDLRAMVIGSELLKPKYLEE